MSDDSTPFEVPLPHSCQRLSVAARDATKVVETWKRQCEIEFRAFYRGLTIEGQTGKRIFENVITDFQREFFEDIADSLESLRIGGMPARQRFWLERTKKASKDADLAIIVLWLTCFPHKPFFGQIAAADKDQAGIVKERISHLLEHNKWLNEHVELVQWEIRSKKPLESGDPMAKVVIMSSDIGGAHGGTPDLLIVNELSHVTKWEFVENLMDNADGVVQGIVIVATNAGHRNTPAWQWRKNAVVSEDWSVHVLAAPAPWHSKAKLEDSRRRNPIGRYNRLWLGKWQSGTGDAISEEKIAAAFAGMRGPVIRPESGWEYLLGLDLGVKHDHSGLMVLGVNQSLQRAKTAYWRGWAPDPSTGEVYLPDVERAILECVTIYRPSVMFYDPSQAILMAQRVRARVACREMSFSRPSNLMAMASCFVQMLNEERLECYDDGDNRLRGDIAKFRIVEKSYGYRLEATSDDSGHADVGTALLICCPYAMAAMGISCQWRPEDDIAADPVELMGELAKEEVAAMPDELREIYEMG